MLLLTKYGAAGPSSRYRFLQYVSEFHRAGHSLRIAPLFDDAYIRRLFNGQKSGKAYLVWRALMRVWVCLQGFRYDKVWIEGELVPYAPAWFERILHAALPKRRYYDYDDAIWLRYPAHRQNKFANIWKGASCVVVGNQYLASYVRENGAHVVTVPTVLEWARYQNAKPSHNTRVVGWIGTPQTVFYLQELAPALVALRKQTDYELRVIGAEWSHPELKINCRPWSLDKEIDELCQLDVGIMPLKDDPWSRGKCGLKLIHYLSCGIPAVASPVGVNADFIEESGGGRTASSAEEWISCLSELLTNVELRRDMGQRARKWAESRVTVHAQAARLFEALELDF